MRSSDTCFHLPDPYFAPGPVKTMNIDPSVQTWKAERLLCPMSKAPNAAIIHHAAAISYPSFLFILTACPGNNWNLPLSSPGQICVPQVTCPDPFTLPSLLLCQMGDISHLGEPRETSGKRVCTKHCAVLKIYCTSYYLKQPPQPARKVGVPSRRTAWTKQRHRKAGNETARSAKKRT